MGVAEDKAEDIRSQIRYATANAIASRSVWSTHFPAFAENEILVGVSSYLIVFSWTSGRLMVI